MKFLHATLGQYGNYILKKSNFDPLISFYYFLMFRKMSIESINKWHNWSQDKYWQEFQSVGTEFSLLTKKNNCISIEGFIADDEYSPFIISKQAFANMLDEWKEILETKPKEVFIYFDGEKVTFETKD